MGRKMISPLDCNQCQNALPRITRDWHGHMNRPVMIFWCKVVECEFIKRSQPWTDERHVRR